MSDDWTAFTRRRLAAYRAQKARHIDVHGEAVFTAMEHFYDVMVRYFTGAKLWRYPRCRPQTLIAWFNSVLLAVVNNVW